MKKLLMVLTFCIATTIVTGQSVAYDSIHYAHPHYLKRMALFNSEPIVKGRIVFLGNSITELGDWKKLLNDSTVINRGIAGDITFGVIARLDEVIAREPSKLFIKIGINDFSHNIPPAVIVRNIVTIMKTVKAKSPMTKIYIQSILPTNDNAKSTNPTVYGKNNIISTINKQLKEYAEKLGATYVDLNKEFSDKDGKLASKYDVSDGLHLSDFAYQEWVKFLKREKYL